MTQEGARMKQRIDAVEQDFAMRERRPWPTSPAEPEQQVLSWVIFVAGILVIAGFILVIATS